jgi:Domain of unknown function (DUF4112)
MTGRAQGDVVGMSRAERFVAVEARIARVTNVLDELVPIPGTGQRIGLDPVIGLIPFVGDAVAGLVGLWVIGEATRFGIPRIAVARMVVNLLADLAVGAVPLLGDLVDVVSHSNSSNLDLFRRHALDPDASTSGHEAFFVGVVLLVVGAVWLIATVIGAVLGEIGAVLGA